MKRRKIVKIFPLVLFFFLASHFCPPDLSSADRSVILATTTSTRDSGLLDVLIPLYESKKSARVKTIAVGTGKALAMAKRGDADVLITHAPEAEKILVAEGALLRRVQFMHNDFVLVGPASDPAGIAGAGSAVEALRRLHGRRSVFVSRGDNSGTHQKENYLWQSAGLTPQAPWYVEAGQGMAATLRIASEKGAYALTDRATYLNLRNTLAAKILFEGDAALLNLYSVSLVNPAAHPRVNAGGAEEFHAWLLGAEALDVIRRYGRKRFGQPLFFVDLPR